MSIRSIRRMEHWQSLPLIFLDIANLLLLKSQQRQNYLQIINKRLGRNKAFPRFKTWLCLKRILLCYPMSIWIKSKLIAFVKSKMTINNMCNVKMSVNGITQNVWALTLNYLITIRLSSYVLGAPLRPDKDMLTLKRAANGAKSRVKPNVTSMCTCHRKARLLPRSTTLIDSRALSGV